MSAYVVVETKVKDAATKDHYSAAAGPFVAEYGGEFVAGGAWTLLAGEDGRGSGAIIRFENRERALACYDSQSYQATLADRDTGMGCRFRPLGDADG